MSPKTPSQSQNTSNVAVNKGPDLESAKLNTQIADTIGTGIFPLDERCKQSTEEENR